jgi:hypothetical protein
LGLSNSWISYTTNSPHYEFGTDISMTLALENELIQVNKEIHLKQKQAEIERMTKEINSHK